MVINVYDPKKNSKIDNYGRIEELLSIKIYVCHTYYFLNFINITVVFLLKKTKTQTIPFDG